MYDKENKLLAKACGVKVEPNDEYPECDKDLYWVDQLGSFSVWSISDARCREVIRNWWLAQDKSRVVSFDATEVIYDDNYDFKTLQLEYDHITNDERIAVAKLFGADKPKDCNKGYKALVKELLKMTDADVDNPDMDKGLI